MINEEAIEIIKIAIAEVEWNYPMDYAIAFENAISALEKQIPKKIKAENIKTSEQIIRFRYCPSCNVRFIRFGMNYCSDCGQALDWSDVK